MRKVIIFNLFCVFLSFCVAAQQHKAVDSIRSVQKDSLSSKYGREKTLLDWDQLGLLYQVALQDITADDKSVEFKSTIFGVHKIFNDSITDSKVYKKLWLQRRIELDLNYKYQGSFNPDNISFGANIGLVNRNDITTSPIINDNKDLFALQKEFDNTAWYNLDSVLLANANTHNPNYPLGAQREYNDEEKLVTKFIITGDTAVFKDDTPLFSLVKNTNGTLYGRTTTFFLAAIDIKNKIDSLERKVKRGLSLTFTPTWTYGLNFGGVQGYEFAFKAIKGMKLLKDEKKTTQFILKGSYKIGDDTIVGIQNLHRNQITDQFGFNQVLRTKSINPHDGSGPADKPIIEFGLTGGYNWILSGLQDNEKAGQPSMTAKLGFMIGKDSWLVFPFSYNFETHRGLASISVKVNIGDPPFK